MHLQFRKATSQEIPQIWELLQKAIQRRKEDGSNQWQDGYPNPEVIKVDIETETGFVLSEGENLVGYCAVLINAEPAYASIEGKWLSNENFVVVHRIAIAQEYLGQGLAKEMMKFIEEFAIQNSIYSVKADTNFDNLAMMKTFEKAGYIYFGEVFFRGSSRKAYEKVLRKFCHII